MPSRFAPITSAPIKFGTSGWRGIIAEDFTFGNVRIVVSAIAQHVLSQASAGNKPVVLVAYDRRFFSEEFARTAAIVLAEHGVTPLLSSEAAPTPAVAFDIRRKKLDGAINFTASHNPAEYHGLKFSGPDGGPALPGVTRDIEARAAKLAAQNPPSGSAYPTPHERKDFERNDSRPAYLQRLNELVRFDVIAGLRPVVDALHGCGAGYLDRTLADHGIALHTIRARRDVLFDGTGPDVSELNLAPLAVAVMERQAQVGLATDGDADRFGIVDADGTWVSPNHILGLLYDYLVESRGWKLDAARSVATSHLLDGVAKHYGQNVHETPVGFKYIGQLILQDAIALGGEESAGLSVRGHVPEKDGILACLLVAEMIAARQAPIAEQLRSLFQRVGREYWPLRVNLDLPDDVKTRAVERLKTDYKQFIGRRVARLDRTDGLKMGFDDGDWILLRLSGTEPLLRIYTESATRQQAAKMAADAKRWIFSAGEGASA